MQPGDTVFFARSDDCIGRLQAVLGGTQFTHAGVMVDVVDGDPVIAHASTKGLCRHRLSDMAAQAGAITVAVRSCPDDRRDAVVANVEARIPAGGENCHSANYRGEDLILCSLLAAASFAAVDTAFRPHLLAVIRLGMGVLVGTPAANRATCAEIPLLAHAAAGVAIDIDYPPDEGQLAAINAGADTAPEPLDASFDDDGRCAEDLTRFIRTTAAGVLGDFGPGLDAPTIALLKSWSEPAGANELADQLLGIAWDPAGANDLIAQLWATYADGLDLGDLLGGPPEPTRFPSIAGLLIADELGDLSHGPIENWLPPPPGEA